MEYTIENALAYAVVVISFASLLSMVMTLGGRKLCDLLNIEACLPGRDIYDGKGGYNAN